MIDFLIVGGGLSGMILADYLQPHFRIRIMDIGNGKQSSRVAAGLFNPVTGRRMVKTWLMSEISEGSLAYFRKKEDQFQRQFVKQLDIERLFHNENQRAEWAERIDFDDLESIILATNPPDFSDPLINRSFGSVVTTKSWQLDTNAFLDSLSAHFMEAGILLPQKFDYLKIGTPLVIDEKEVQQVIFAEGLSIHENPIFRYLPLNPNKGELLVVELSEDLPEERIFMKGIFVFSLGGKKAIVGASYKNNFSDNTPENESRQWLEDRLVSVLKIPYRVIEHRAGIRPATIDRRPFIGRHPGYNNCMVFNGFGSKGVSLIPFFANNLSKYLQGQESIHKEADIARFHHLLK